MKLKTVFDIEIKSELLKIQKQNILSLLGYDADTSDEHVGEVLNKCLEESKKLIQPKGGFVIQKTEKIIPVEGKLFVDDQEFHIHRIIGSQVKNAGYIAFFVCTIGKGVEKKAKEYMDKGDLLEGYIMDLIGSEAAEETAEQIQQSIKEHAAKDGLNITNRFSPGYCNWSVSEQFKLFGFFPEEFSGIRLTESALMNPVKSVSGLVGIGEKVKFRPYTCSMCSDENCIYRNRKK